MNNITVVAIGSKVRLDSDIPARVTAICLRGTNISYECVWWDERNHKTDWFCEEQFRPENGDSHKTVSITQR